MSHLKGVDVFSQQYHFLEVCQRMRSNDGSYDSCSILVKYIFGPLSNLMILTLV